MSDVLQINLPTLGYYQSVLIKGLNDTNVQQYYMKMKKIISSFGAAIDETTDKEILELLNFEIELAKIMPPKEEHLAFEIMYNPIKFADLQKKFLTLPLQQIISNIFSPLTIQKNDIINVHFLKFFSNLEILLSKTPKRYEHTQNELIQILIRIIKTVYLVIYVIGYKLTT